MWCDKQDVHHNEIEQIIAENNKNKFCKANYYKAWTKRNWHRLLILKLMWNIYLFGKSVNTVINI